MKLTIDLSPDEEYNLRAWVGMGQYDPAFADNPWRIVLQERTRARYDQVAAQFAEAPPGDPLARIFAAPSQWAKWLDQSSAESEALIAGGYLTREDKNRLNNWWQQNGVKGRRDGNRYVYYTYPAGVETLNVDTGGADAATEQACGQAIPGPAI